MNHQTPSAQTAAAHVDVLIIGAGISGIGMAVHLKEKCPDRSFMMIERRSEIGGTWNLFNYPGIRSDSDMHTLGFEFEPWREQKAIADGPSILNYLHQIKDQRGLTDHIRLGHKVVSARWSSSQARWTIKAEVEGQEIATITANFLYMGTGYYDYDEGYDPAFAGRETFGGEIIHPQFWPKDFDYAGKRIVVIGSGATAVTIVPSVADKAAHVTMLQRTPTWYFIRPAKDWLANALRKVMPDSWAYRFIRFKNVRMQQIAFKRARKDPAKVGEFLLNKVRKDLGPAMQEADFTPPYGPWEQRLCLVPDGDMFQAIRDGKADIVTDHIERFTPTGIELKSGRHLDADVIITATGLKLAMAGKVAFSIDGAPVDFTQRFYYKGCMFSDMPNMAIVFGYLNASWTLKVDIVATFVCRVLNHMRATGSEIAVPRLGSDGAVNEEQIFDFSSGYVQRALNILPKQGDRMPWRLNQDYLFDRKVLREERVDDGVLAFEKAHGGVEADTARETAIAAE
ncbi:flavin-containing monooxygenase [Blastomonas sp.]|uniref:flavin-containing monooxygenase n=1 Tax=Blastomonas sp. TaxID=1909299 RepID=UPI0035943FA7